ncbi:MAG: hypothetical protein HOC74_04455 [Gemmatimonadetes bacterium]|jgi:hypothetical protein|nr:hypothetical protein [Gemmatimonadota bacterium]
MFHPDEDRTDVFEIYDQQAADLAEQETESLIHQHARIVCEEGYPQARFRKVVDDNTVWTDDAHSREIEVGVSCFL